MKRILIVDDEKYVCDVLKEFLSSKGYDVYTALDGVTALELAQEIKPQMMLLDIIMPGMTGIEVLKEIKKRDPSITVVMATAVSDEGLAKRAMELGAFDYVVKPFNLDYLEAVVMVKMADLLG